MNQAAKRDLFISSAPADEDWVRGYLVGELGLAPDRVLTRTDLQLGQSIAREVERAVESTRYTVLVMSRAYLDDEWAGFGEDLATFSGVEANAAKLIPLLLQPIQVPLRLRYKVSLDCTTEAKQADAAQQLRVFLEQPDPRPEPPIPCPYPGMSSFEPSQSDDYFGRSALIEDTLRKLRLEPFIALVGASGSGKSSFLNAGLVPKLDGNPLLDGRAVKALSFRPGRLPMGRLATTLAAELGRDPAEMAAELEADGGALTRLLESVAAAGPANGMCVLIVDQFEEVFAPSVAADDRQKFFDRLDTALASLPPNCRVMIAVRADFYDDCLKSTLSKRVAASQLPIVAMTREELREAIRGPAQRHGVYVEPALVERLIDDTLGEPGSLPLLQETLVLLWSSHLRRRLLTLSSYDGLRKGKLTGIEVAMVDRADATLKTLSERGEDAIARRIFVRLTELDVRHTRRQQSLDELVTSAADEAAVRVVIDVLVAHGLLTTDRDEDTGEPLVDLAHEKLIEKWPQFQTWLRAYGRVEKDRRELVDAAERWDDRKREPSYLFDGHHLTSTDEWVSSSPGEIGELEEEFLEASKRRERRQRIMRLGGIGVAVALTVIVIAAVVSFGGRELQRRGTGSDVFGFAAGPAILFQESPTPGDREVNVGPFRIEITEVSVDQYRHCVDAGSCDRPDIIQDAYWTQQLTYPIVWVTADQATAYCTWIGRRLPLAIEWQRAMRGTTGRAYPWGDSPADIAEELRPVDATPSTATPDGIFGLYDNAGEWVVTPESAAPYGIAGGFDTGSGVVGAVLNDEGLPDQNVGFRCAMDGR
jgi:hypothetical protein